MRTDVKLGVISALVLVLGAGGYFMFRGDKQAAIPLAETTPGSAGNTQIGKTANPTKTAANQPKNSQTTTTKRPAINIKPPVNDPNSAARPPRVASPVNPATPNPGSMVPRPSNSSPTTVPPSAPNSGSADRIAANATPPATATQPISPASTPVTEAQPTTSAPPGRTENPPTSREVTLTGVPAASPASAPASPTTAPANPPSQPSTNMMPLANSPSTTANPPAAPVASAAKPGLPPGIQPAVSAPVTEPARKPEPDAAQETHRVQVGDSLTFLAQTYYGDPKYAKIIADANPSLTDPNNLKVGTRINIPPLPKDADERVRSTSAVPAKGSEKADGKENGGRVYTVKAGDSFYSIAKSQLGNASRWKELLALNHSVVNGDPTSLRPGQRIVLPDSR